MFGKPSRVVPLIALAAAVPTGCDRSRAEPVATPPVSAVEVPAVPADTEHSRTDNRRAEQPPPPDEPDDDEPIDIDIAEDAGSVQFSAVSDGGVRFWGHFTVLDGGFSFQGSFSTGTASGTGSDAGSNGPP